jgi:hypothetical protein
MNAKADCLRAVRFVFAFGEGTPGTRWLYVASLFGVYASATLLLDMLLDPPGSEFWTWWLTTGAAVNLVTYLMLAQTAYRKRNQPDRHSMIWMAGLAFAAAFFTVPVFGLILFGPALFFMFMAAPR